MLSLSGPRNFGGPAHRRQKALTPIIGSEAREAPEQVLPGTGAGSAKLVESIQHCLDEAKAEEIVTIDLVGKTSIADVMIVASGRSRVHVGAVAERVVKACKDAGLAPRVEGLPNCDWVLIDAGDTIIHVFRPEVRQFYNLEKMWSGDRPMEQANAKRPA